jgi:hypothetical protein
MEHMMLVPSPPVFDVFSDALLLLSSVVFRLLGLMCRLATDSLGLNALISATLLGTYFGLAWLLTVRTTDSASVHSISATTFDPGKTLLPARRGKVPA